MDGINMGQKSQTEENRDTDMKLSTRGVTGPVDNESKVSF